MSAPTLQRLRSPRRLVCDDPLQPKTVRSAVWMLALAAVAVLAASVAHKLTRDGTLAWAEAYARVLAQVQADPRIASGVGMPSAPLLEPTFELDGAGGATLKFTVSGPKGVADVVTRLDEATGGWDPVGSEVSLSGAPRPIHLPRPRPVPASDVAERNERPVSAVPSPSALRSVATPAVTIVADEETPIRIVRDGARFEPAVLEARAGDWVRLLFTNEAEIGARNLVIVPAAKASAFLAAVADMRRGDLARPVTGWVPDGPEWWQTIVASSGTALPGETLGVSFRAPREPGDYAIVCTVPVPSGLAPQPGLLRVKPATQSPPSP